MANFSELSDKAYAAIRTFFEKFEEGTSLAFTPKILLASLYAKSLNPNQKCLEILKYYVIDLKQFLGQQEIDNLIAELPAVLYFCSNHPFRGRGYERIPSTYRPMIPYSIMDLINGIVILSGNEVRKAYLPYAGCCEFPIQHPEFVYFGFERDAETWAVSQILLEQLGVKAKISRKETALQADDLFDTVFSFPPIYGDHRQNRGIVNDFIDIATDHLSAKGEIIMLLPMTFCFASSGWFDFRKTISEKPNLFSISVISLPSRLLKGTSIPLCVVRLMKDGKGEVHLVDATSDYFIIEGTQGAKDIDSDAILNEIAVNNPQYIWKGKWSDLKGDINLTPSRYLINQAMPKLKDGYERVTLDKVISIKGHIISHSEEPLPVIGMAELSSNYLSPEVKIRKSTNIKEVRRILPQECLIAGFMGGTFKVGRYSGGKASIRHELFPFEINSEYKDKISEDFLFRCILSEQSRSQAAALSSGSVISRIKRDDFLSILIDIPSRDEQDKLVLSDSRSALTDSDRKLLESFDEFRKDLHVKKHAIGQTIFNFKNWWKLLMLARERGNGILEESAEIPELEGATVSDIFDNLKLCLFHISKRIKHLDPGNGLVPTQFALADFVSDYITNHPNPVFSYSFEDSLHRMSSDVDTRAIHVDDEKKFYFYFKGDTPGIAVEWIEFPTEALTMIMDDIVSNACAHGFGNKIDPANKLHIDLEVEGSDCILTISNNGAPLDTAKIKPEDVMVYSKTSQEGLGSHLGIGAYEVKQLMTEFGGKAEFVANPKNGMNVAYRLTFSNCIIISSDGQ